MVRHAGRYNPDDWASTAGREALSAETHCGTVPPRPGGLPALATRAFRSYQRSL